MKPFASTETVPKRSSGNESSSRSGEYVFGSKGIDPDSKMYVITPTLQMSTSACDVTAVQRWCNDGATAVQRWRNGGVWWYVMVQRR